MDGTEQLDISWNNMIHLLSLIASTGEANNLKHVLLTRQWIPLVHSWFNLYPTVNCNYITIHTCFNCFTIALVTSWTGIETPNRSGHMRSILYDFVFSDNTSYCYVNHTNTINMVILILWRNIEADI